MLKSLDVVGKFLKDLTSVMTYKDEQEVTARIFTLVDTLYRHYIYKNNLPPSDYSSKKVLSLMGDHIAAEVLFKMKDVDIEQLIGIVKKK